MTDHRDDDAPAYYRHGRHLTVLQTAASTVVALGILLTPAWHFVLQPLLATSVESAMAEEIKDQVRDSVAEQLTPVKEEIRATNSGLEAIIQLNIERLEDEIAELEYERDYGENGAWTDDRARSLVKKRRSLLVQKHALQEIRQANNE